MLFSIVDRVQIYDEISNAKKGDVSTYRVLPGRASTPSPRCLAFESAILERQTARSIVTYDVVLCLNDDSNTELCQSFLRGARKVNFGITILVIWCELLHSDLGLSCRDARGCARARPRPCYDDSRSGPGIKICKSEHQCTIHRNSIRTKIELAIAT